MRLPLLHCQLLDTRPKEIACVAPIAEAVNIPLEELAGRMYELPPRTKTIEIAALDASAAAAQRFLEKQGRRANIVLRPPPAPVDAPPIVGRLWEPTPLLAQFAPRLHIGDALELACGTGRDAVFLASLGWGVTAADVLGDAIDRARRLSLRYAAAIERIQWRVTDLESNAGAITGRFDLITIFRYLHRPLFPQLKYWLQPGGTVIVETFTTVHRDKFGKPAQDSHVLLPGELRGYFDGFEILHDSEDWREWGHTGQIVARK